MKSESLGLKARILAQTVMSLRDLKSTMSQRTFGWRNIHIYDYGLTRTTRMFPRTTTELYPPPEDAETLSDVVDSTRQPSLR